MICFLFQLQEEFSLLYYLKSCKYLKSTFGENIQVTTFKNREKKDSRVHTISAILAKIN